MSFHRHDRGFSLLEVMIAMVIAGVALTGTMGAMEISSRHVQQGQVTTRALALAQARLEAKWSARWAALLEDDLDHDGIAEVMMKDDGQEPDHLAGDGIYSALHRKDGVTVIWTVQGDRPGPLQAASVVVINATAFYEGVGGTKEIRLATLRANPNFAGLR